LVTFVFDIHTTLGLYKSLFKQTAIYGLATVFPRIMGFLLVPLYVSPGMLAREEYGQVNIIFAYMIFFNVVLSYGMETAFFRFYNKEADKHNVAETSTISIFWSSLLFLAIALIFRTHLAALAGIDSQYITYGIWILVLDALVIIPFSTLRAKKQPGRYAMVKMGNVSINVLLNLFFLLYLPAAAKSNPGGFLEAIFIDDYEIGYIFISNLIASFLTFVVLSKCYFHVKWHFDYDLWKRMMKYGVPILVAGIAFAINEQFDKILLQKLLPPNTAEAQVGIYAACYKLGLFMVLFRTAYTLGIEPFFFSHASNPNAPQTYATVTKYFVIFGSLISLTVIIFADLLKQVMIPNPEYWEAMKIVPLIVLANFFLGIYTNLSVWYKLIDKTYYGAYISIIGAFVTLALNFLLIPIFSYYGSAIATIAAYGSMMIISYYLGNKYYPIPYDMKKIFGYLGLSIAFSAISFYMFREKYYVGIPLLLVFAFFIYYNERETLNGILKTKRT
jgi:O-antigen/teichoic acid export membrane protein